MRIAYIVSGVDRMVSLEWTLTALQEQGHELLVLLLEPGSTKFADFLTSQHIRHETFVGLGKSRWLATILALAKQLRQAKIEVVHCHFLLAGMLGLAAARLAGIPRRIYTRHHGAEHHLGHKQGVYIDKVLNRLATRIIAISPVVNTILTQWEGVAPAKIAQIPHGYDFSGYETVNAKRVAAVRQRHGIPTTASPVVGVVSRYDKPKGIHHIIAAFRRIKAQYPAARLVLANARGSYKAEIQALLCTLPADSYTEIEYEYDSVALYKMFDVFVHVPESAEYESFGLVYIEALAAGIPSVFTISGIASEFIRSEKNALVVPYSNADAITAAVLRLLEDQPLAARLVKQGRTDVLERFQFEEYFRQLQQLYR